MAMRIVVSPEPVDYEVAWARQREWHSEVVKGAEPITWLLEHDSVFTAGRRTQPEDRPLDGSRVIDVDRGGRITWHGPGQLVGYPILRLPAPFDVVAHVRRIEDLLIGTCSELGVRTCRIAGRSGVWVPADGRGPDRKVAAIGIRVAQEVTMHGFAINADPDLTCYDRIVPCGIRDASVTSLSYELGRDVTVAEVRRIVAARLPDLLTNTVTTTAHPARKAPPGPEFPGPASPGHWTSNPFPTPQAASA